MFPCNKQVTLSTDHCDGYICIYNLQCMYCCIEVKLTNKQLVLYYDNIMELRYETLYILSCFKEYVCNEK